MMKTIDLESSNVKEWLPIYYGIKAAKVRIDEACKDFEISYENFMELDDADLDEEYYELVEELEGIAIDAEELLLSSDNGHGGAHLRKLTDDIYVEREYESGSYYMMFCSEDEVLKGFEIGGTDGISVYSNIYKGDELIPVLRKVRKFSYGNDMAVYLDDERKKHLVTFSAEECELSLKA